MRASESAAGKEVASAKQRAIWKAKPDRIQGAEVTVQSVQRKIEPYSKWKLMEEMKSDGCESQR